jgi:hypothetical protein
MSNCIYCRCELPSVVPAEHLIPQNFGRFKPDLTLTCVCSGYFGSRLEWPMLNESIEGMRRLQFGFKGKVGGIRTKALSPSSVKETTGKVHARHFARTRMVRNIPLFFRRSEPGALHPIHLNGAP